MSPGGRALVWAALGAVVLVGGLRLGPDLFLDPPLDPEGDDAGLTRTLDVLPWVLLVLAGYLLVVAVVEMVLRRRR